MKRLYQWRKTIITVVVFAAACALIHFFGFHIVSISGSSMNQTLRSGDYALSTRFDYLFGIDPKRGDIAECRFPDRSGTYIKRVIGLPGETIEISEGRLYIDGEALSEPYVSSPSADYSVTLGEDEYLVLGDNRADSHDSRAADMGLLSEDDFIGRVRFVIFPFRNIE